MPHGPLAATARLWYSRMLRAAPSTASPRDSPRVHVGDGPADRILLFGNGVLHGWGVPLRGLAVPGHLAQLLHQRTGRAAIVDNVGEERMSAASALDWLGDAAGRGHDVAIIAVGLNDALRLTPLAAWEEHVRELVDRVLADQDPQARVLLVGVPHVRAFAMADSALGSVAQRHADRMTAVLEQLAAERDAVEFVPAPEERFEIGRPIGSPAMYRAWAEQLLPALLPSLEAVRALRPPGGDRHPVEDVWEWAGTPAALASDGTGAQQQLEALTESIRERFGVAMAGVNVVDGSQVYSIAGKGGGPRQLPRSLAYCDRTVRRDAPTLIRDASEDPEFEGNPFLEVVGLPFYAGVPLHALDGRAVATLCLLDDHPRSDVDPVELERFVQSAEAALRTFETGEPSAPPATAPASAAAPLAPEAEPEAEAGIAAAAADTIGLRVLAVLLRPTMHAVLSRFLRRQARPHWDNRAIVVGPDPLRVLLFGAGLAVGYGSDGADDPLPARLGAALAEATGRGVVVETRARPSVPLEQSLDLLGNAGAATFDHVVWSPTLEEAVRGSSRRWTGQLRHIIGAVRSSGPAHLQMTLLGLPLMEGDHVLNRVGQVLGRQVNRRIEAAARSDVRTGYLAVPDRVVPDYDTPLFDTAYRDEVTALLVQHILQRGVGGRGGAPQAAGRAASAV